MRIWDIPCSKLCRQHLLGEHRELHAIWVILNSDKKSPYKNHPEVKRWKNYLSGLLNRHNEQAIEMKKREYKHKSNISIFNNMYTIIPQQNFTYQWQSTGEQIKILKQKGCKCYV